jgi:hypothetical protein
MADQTLSTGGYSPEDDGLPDYADDTSYAEDSAIKPTFNDSAPALPVDGPDYSDEYGVTAREDQHAERLAARLEREQPDRPEHPADVSAGRLVAGFDSDGDPTGYDSGEHEGLSAEEAAVHVITDDVETNIE